MFTSCQGRIGQTATGDQAPIPSTSGCFRPLHPNRHAQCGRRKQRQAVLAQLQQEEKQEWSSELSPRRKRVALQQSKPERLERKNSTNSSGSGHKAGTPQLPHQGGSQNNWLLAKWENLPSQYKLVFACAWAFVICNMDKVNISVAIISMSRDFGWSPTTSGIVQSSFFAGYMFTQIPGGYVVSRFGGRKVLPSGVSMWSIATAATPLLAGTLPGILLCRVLVGLGEGVAPTSATDMVARVCKQSERSRAIGFIFSGLHVGSLAGLLVAPVLIEQFGWPAVFYMFGGAGLLWSVWWESLMKGIQEKDPEMAAKLDGRREMPGEASATGSEPVPWRGFLRNTPVRALAYVHFCNNWNAYVMTAWLPSYFSDSLSLDLTQASQAALFPPIAAIIASSIAGPVADHLISQGAAVAPVRKAAQAIAFLGPAVFLGLSCQLGGGGAENEMLTVALISAALGLASVSVAGLYSNHADLSPRHASILLGLTNTMGAIPGIVGVTFVGVIFDQTRDWNLALFAPSIFFFLTGTIVFALFGSADEQTFEEEKPFWVEKFFRPVVNQVAKLSLGSTSTAFMGRLQAMLDKVKVNL